MSDRIFITDGSGTVKGALFYDSASDEIRLASYNDVPVIDGYVSISSAGLSENGAGAITSGTWTPVFSAITNLDSTPTVVSRYYSRNGAIVTLFINVTIDPTAASAWNFTFTPPVASNFTATADAVGFGSGASSTGIIAFADASADELSVSGTATGTASQTVRIGLQYEIK